VSADVHYLEEIDNNTRSNRSSATIRPVGSSNAAANGSNGNGAPNADGFVPDFDFDNALFKFAAERENFLDDLSFSAGAKVQGRH
jgi:hypothetical protein